MDEQRRFTRVPIQLAVTFGKKGDDQRGTGTALDIAVGGMFIATDTPAAFNSDVVVYARLPGGEADVELPGRVRWAKKDGMGVQFGLLGARETHAITEIARKHEEDQGAK